MLAMAADDLTGRGDAARQRIINLFTLEDAYRKFLQIWQSAIGRSAASIATIA
jgi:hypothetical protein